MTDEEIKTETLYRVTERLGILYGREIVTPAQAFTIKQEAAADVAEISKTQPEFSLQ